MLPKNYKKFKPLIIITVVFILLIIIFFKVDRDIRPVLFATTNAEVRIIATEAINSVVKDELSKNIKYSDFVSVRTDNNGDITSIDLNTVEINKLGTNVALRVQEQLKSIGGKGVSIPLGIVTGSALFSYYGPRLNVKVSPVGNVACSFKSELQSAGVNQTRYMVSIDVNANLQVLIPLENEKINVESTVPIAETLIVGKVPSFYYNGTLDPQNSTRIIPIPTPEVQ